MTHRNNAKHVAEYKQRLKDAGYIRIEMFLHKEDAILVRQLADKLKEKRDGQRTV